MSMLTVTVEKLDVGLVLHCAGRIVRGDETALLCAASRQHGRTVMLDLEKVEVIDAAGIGALVALQAAGIYVQLMNPNERVREILRVTQVDSLFEISAPPTSSIPAQAVA
jgi:anti-anti-sigma factor